MNDRRSNSKQQTNQSRFTSDRVLTERLFVLEGDRE
jgi:hypothetical protein